MVPDAGHFTLNEKPARIADLILEMVSADAGS
jgi:pimeloyl-ACP methyl ester carboxylesterase